MRIIIILFFAVFISACSSTYEQNILTEPNTKLIKNKSIIISTPQNGFYEHTEYKGSGRATASAIRAAFLHYSNQVTVNHDCSDLICLRRTQISHFDYYVIPEILHWEDRATEWSGKPDRIKIKIALYEGENLTESASTVISGKSKWATFGGDHPEDLLEVPVNQYIQSLF